MPGLASHAARCPALVRATLAVATLLLLAAPARAVAATTFRAGASAVDITPPHFPISLNGHMQDRAGKSALDKLHVRCLLLDDGKGKLALAVVDSCVVPRPIMDEAKRRASEKTGIPADRMLVSATHTHSAPTVGAVFQSEPDAEYVAFLTAKIAEAIETAHANLEPARVAWGTGSDPTQVFSRRWLMKPGTAITNPFGGTTNDRAQMHPGYQNPNAIRPITPVDPTIGLLAAMAPDGRPIGLLANYGMHYAGYGIPSDTASADYFGRFCDRIEAELGRPDSGRPPFVAILSNGPCAETHCYDYSQPRKELTLDTVAASVSKHALEAYRKLEFHDHAPIVVKETTLELDARWPTDDELQRARAVWSKVQSEGRACRDLGEIYARETVLLVERPRRVELKLQVIRIGGLGIAAIPCEVYGDTGLALKSVSPMTPTFTIELANGYNGYLPPPEQFPLGGYTTWRARSSYLEPQAEPKVKAVLSRLLTEVAGDTQP